MNDLQELESELESQGIPRGTYRVKPLDRMRKMIASRLTSAARDVPHFALDTEIEIDALLSRRAVWLAEGTRVSVNDLVIKASGLALHSVPEANTSFMAQGIVYHDSADVAVAVAIDGGLITPIVRDAQRKSVQAISAEMRDLAARAQTRRLKPDEYVGGTFSVSNLGMYGVSRFGSIINPPHGAILSVGAARDRLALRNGEVSSSKVLTVTLTCDHRVIDGVIGARWLLAFRALVETPDPLFA